MPQKIPRYYAIEDHTYIPPFNETASQLEVMNKPLWLWHQDVLAPYCESQIPVPSLEDVPSGGSGEVLIYRDNLFFDEPFIETFLTEARARGVPCRAAFRADDAAFKNYALPLARGFTSGEAVDPDPAYSSDGGKRDFGKRDLDAPLPIYFMDLWYFPNGYDPAADPEAVIIHSDYQEGGYYETPYYMSRGESGDITFHFPDRSALSIESWMHAYYANVVFGLFARGNRIQNQVNDSNLVRLKYLLTAALEGKQILESSALVFKGKNVRIDPSATVQGPTWIGDNVVIDSGAVVNGCIIGNDVTISQGCQLMASVVGDQTFLPFRSALFFTAVMKAVIVAQNTCLQFCIVGRNSFVGAGNTFTDFNVMSRPLKAANALGDLENTGQVLLGGCVGHNCRIGSGMIVFPARMIESDVVLVATEERRVIDRNVTYEQSDHHQFRDSDQHPRLYPRADEESEIEDEW